MQLPFTGGHVFISYSRRDTEAMLRIVSFLRERGINAWVDNEKLVPGTPIGEREIEKAIDKSAAVVVVLSPDAKESVWVLNELTLADEYKKRVFPVLVRGDIRKSVHFRLVTRQFVDLRTNEESGLESLSAALGYYLDELKRIEEDHEVERLKKEREASEYAVREAEELAIKEDAEKLALERKTARLLTEQKEKIANKQREKQAIKKGVEEKITENFKRILERIPNILTIFQRQSALKLTLVGAIGLSVIVTAVWGASSLNNIGSATDTPLAPAPITESASAIMPTVTNKISVTPSLTLPSKAPTPKKTATNSTPTTTNDRKTITPANASEVVLISSLKADGFFAGISNDFSSVAIVSDKDWTIKLWNLMDETLITTLAIQDEVRAVMFSPTGIRLPQHPQTTQSGFGIRRVAACSGLILTT